MLLDNSEPLMKTDYLEYSEEEQILYKRFICNKESNMQKVQVYHMSIQDVDPGYNVILVYGTPQGTKLGTFYVSKGSSFGVLQVGSKGCSYAIIANVKKEGIFSTSRGLELFKLYYNPNTGR